MTITTRARLSDGPCHGLIKLTKLKGKKPLCYSLQLFHRKNGFVKTQKTEFKTVQQAIGHASLYGFNSSIWSLETKEIN